MDHTAVAARSERYVPRAGNVIDDIAFIDIIDSPSGMPCIEESPMGIDMPDTLVRFRFEALMQTGRSRRW